MHSCSPSSSQNKKLSNKINYNMLSNLFDDQPAVQGEQQAADMEADDNSTSHAGPSSAADETVSLTPFSHTETIYPSGKGGKGGKRVAAKGAAGGDGEEGEESGGGKRASTVGAELRRRAANKAVATDKEGDRYSKLEEQSKSRAAGAMGGSFLDALTTNKAVAEGGGRARLAGLGGGGLRGRR